jgi:dienelactone hydrolase
VVFWLALVLALAACAPPTRLPVPAAIPSAEPVRFESNDADLTGGSATLIDAWMFRPAGEGPFPALVALHGCNGLYSRGGLTKHMREWAERLVALGYVVLLPDSFSPRGAKQTCSDPGRVQPGVERSRDAYGALLYLERQPFVQPNAVGVLGWSNGGTTVLATVAAGSRARPASLAHDFRVAVAFYPSCRRAAAEYNTDPARPVTPLHVLIGANDDWNPALPCVELGERARALSQPVEVVVYPGAHHGFDSSAPLQTRSGVATPSGRATIGTDPAARADSIERVARILEAAQRPEGRAHLTPREPP